MSRQIVTFTALTTLLAIGIAACGASLWPSAPGTATATAVPSPTVVLTGFAPEVEGQRALRPASASLQTQITPTPAPEIVRVWWPDELYPQNDELALETLQAQWDGFAQAYPMLTLEVRRKRSSGLGGILSTLRTAEPVAPGALPDLTLMRRGDMITAANEGLIVPLDDWLPDDLADNNLLPGVRSLGEINGVLYGVPYALNVVHAAYRPAALAVPPTSFEEVLATRTPYLFPAGAIPISWTLLLQYRAAGGRLVDETGTAILDAQPLLDVLEFYAQGVQAGLFGPALLQYVRYEDYWNQFVAAASNLVAVDTFTFLGRRDSVPNARPVSIPTPDGTPITALDGWMWVVTTQNPERYQRVSAFLAWMMRVGQQSLFTEALGMLPSQTRALRLWDDREYAEFAQDLLATAILVPEAQRNNNASLALQEALVAVLEGTAPDAAADDALARFE
jgi:ABC-type glycerol-3-phosphate transport system substrate-binding protein